MTYNKALLNKIAGAWVLTIFAVGISFLSVKYGDIFLIIAGIIIAWAIKEYLKHIFLKVEFIYYDLQQIKKRLKK
jgi:hypothetical protein